MDYQEMKTVEDIKKWVGERKSFYFFLPDGPYGRSFDNQYLIESIDLTDKGLGIKFNNDLALYFTGELDVIDQGCNLLITQFKTCHFEQYDSLLKTFDYGEVVLNGF